MINIKELCEKYRSEVMPGKREWLIKEYLNANDLEDLYGGPAEWPRNTSPVTQEEEDLLVNVWNEAVEACLKVVRGD